MKMDASQKRKFLKALAAGHLRPEDLGQVDSGIVTHVFQDIADKPGLYLLEGKEYSEAEKSDFTRHIEAKAKTARLIGGAEYFVITMNRTPRPDQKEYETLHPGIMHVSLDLQ